jgi:hypothetical protein
MLRSVAIIGMVLTLVLLAGSGTAADNKVQNSQMVKGTIKLVDPAKNLLVINQKVKNEVVDRELSITGATKFIIMTGKDKKETAGKDGLFLLEGKQGAAVNVKCDKDVNVLQVNVTIKK